MNLNGIIYFNSQDSNNTNKEDCGAVILKDTTLEKQPSYKERHKNDYDNLPLWARILDTFKPALIACAVLLVIFKVFIMSGFIPSESMQPTLNIGDGIIVNRLSYLSSDPERGDIVVFDSDEYGEYLIKRIIGLPGDKIDIKEGCVYVNGCKLIEEYACGETTPSLNRVTHYEVPENSVFLLGDNRDNSADSRWWTDPYVEYGDIVGKAVFQYSLNINNGIFAKFIDNTAPSFMVE